MHSLPRKRPAPLGEQAVRSFGLSVKLTNLHVVHVDAHFTGFTGFDCRIRHADDRRNPDHFDQGEGVESLGGLANDFPCCLGVSFVWTSLKPSREEIQLLLHSAG